MNTSKLKSYAPAARIAFIEAVTRRAGVLGIQPSRVEEVTETGDIALIGGQPFPRSIVPLRKKLIERIGRDGFGPVMEATAYTWFNRFVAIRFMELHGYFDHGFRVLSDPQGGAMPEILQKADQVCFDSLEREEVIHLKLAGNRDEELYRLLLTAQCQQLNRIMPDVFGQIDDETLLLLPDNLLHSDSLVRQLVAGSDEEDWEQVEVLGWLYQFYISERKDQVMARKSAVPTEDIPAVTQLFTPHWIVRYLVENSLGRLWLLNRPGSRLREHMPYYIEGEPETDFLKITKPEEIRLIDPACGSGHMLTYAFDLLTLIYEEEGYTPTEIPALILRHNLCGLEICPRAAQLAEIALVFKAREKARRFFQPSQFVRPNIIALQDIRFEENELQDFIGALNLGELFNQPALKLMHQFEEATNFGSLIQPCLDERAIGDLRQAIKSKDLGGQLFLRKTHLKVLCVLDQAEVLTQRYHIVVANPPYMGSRVMNGIIKAFLQTNYTDYKSDLFAAFFVRSLSLSLPNGNLGFMSPFVWMFISSYSALRKRLVSETTIITLVQLEYSGFEGATVPICTFVIQNSQKDNYKGGYIRLSDFRGSENQGPKTLEAIANPNCGWFFKASANDFGGIPGSPIAYWVSPQIRTSFRNCAKMGDIAISSNGIQTGNNNKYTRTWAEVDSQKIRSKWHPYSKGGDYRKWYGNLNLVVNWEDNGAAIKAESNCCIRGEEFYFKPGITWSDITSARLSFRYLPPGCLFDAKGPTAFYKTERDMLVSLGILNSEFSHIVSKILNPTLSFQSGDFRNIPVSKNIDTVRLTSFVTEAVAIEKADWDNFETSWDFRDQPLLRSDLKGATLDASWRNWEAQSTAAIRRMQELETENNRIFIAAYGIEGELQPEVPEDQITLARADARRDMATFLSYAVGCMMGRYSLSTPGLVMANQGENLEEFSLKLNEACEWNIPTNEFADPQDLLDATVERCSFLPDADGIVPLTEFPWFNDDAATRSEEFLRVTFGPDKLEENLQFLASSLGIKEGESPRDALRRYFVDDFFKNHISGERAYGYKNRPIYWLFSSGKQKAFQCLVYLHRYTPSTLARMRTEYVIPLQGKIAARIAHLEEEKTHATASAQRRKLQTEQDKLTKQQAELIKFDEQLRHYADQRIAIDLDDGVKVNYAKFGPLVAESKKICGTKED